MREREREIVRVSESNEARKMPYRTLVTVILGDVSCRAMPSIRRFKKKTINTNKNKHM